MEYVRNNVNYCFFVADKNGNIGVGKHKAIIAPVLKVEQTATAVTAIAAEPYISHNAGVSLNARKGDSISLDGDLLAIGVRDVDGHHATRAGAVYIFRRSGATWTLEQEISDEFSGFTSLLQSDFFGSSVSLDGDRLVVGTPEDDGFSGSNTGAVYIFKRTGTTWTLEQEISDESSGFTSLLQSDFFGSSVSLDGDRLVVGTPEDNGFSGSNTGAVYIFKRTGTTWTLEQEISDKSYGFTSLSYDDLFGSSVSLDGDRLVVGAPQDDGSGHWNTNSGAVYIFKRTGTTWTLEQEISDKSTSLDRLAAGDKFGHSISLDEDRLAVGAPYDDSIGADKGAVYLFKRTGEIWTLEQEITYYNYNLGHTGVFPQVPRDSYLHAKFSHFGGSVSLDGNRLAVGSYLEGGHSGKSTGAAYIFRRTGTTWDLEQSIVDELPSFEHLYSGDWFGKSVVLDGLRLAIGAPGDGIDSTNSGAVYVFEKATDDLWSDTVKIRENPVTTPSSWQNFKTSNTTEPNCDSNDVSLFGTAATTANTVSISSADNNKWVCFRAKNSADVYSYVKYKVDTDTPSVSITLSGDTLTASTTATDIATVPHWQNSEHTSNPNCANATIWNDGSSVENVAYGNYYCFKISDLKGNTGYGKYRVVQPTPSLSVIQTPTEATALPSASNPILAANDSFGTTVVLDGDYLAVGVPADDGDSGSATGAVYVYKKSGSTWALEQEISDRSAGFNHLDLNDKFGSAIALNGVLLAVGAPGDNGQSGADTGAVYVFRRAGTVWLLEQEISDKSTGFMSLLGGDSFGSSVALDGVRLAVGSPGDDGDSDYDTGAVYIFKRANNNWSLEQEISDQTGGFDKLGSDNKFGVSVDMDGAYLAVGAEYDDGASGPYTGAVYIFKRTKSLWRLQQEISDQSVGFSNLEAEDYFGNQIDLDGAYLAVGAPGDNGASGIDTGAVYIFKRTSDTWALEQEIVDQFKGFTQLEAQDQFGYAVSLDDSRLAVGAIGDDGFSGQDSGAVYIFKRTGTSWALEQAIVDKVSDFNQLSPSDNLGKSVALDGSSLLVGAPGDDGGSSNTGAAYLFSKNAQHKWSNTEKLRDNPAVNRSSWQNFTTTNSTAPSCSLANNTSFGSASSSANVVLLNSTDHNKWICFRAKNSANTYSYVKKQIKITALTLILTQNNTTVSASTSGLSGHGYFTSVTDPTCDATKTTGWTTGTSKTALTNNTWICFRALNPLSVYEYAELQVNLNQPTITIEQDQISLEASATMTGSPTIVTTSWAHTTPSATDQTCSSASYDSAGASENTVTITSSNNNEYVCFKVQNSVGVYGYKKWRIDYNAPSVSVIQNDNTLTASSTATDLPATPVWKHSGPLDDDPTCSDSTITYGTTANSVTSATDGKYYCFKVADKAGNHGYGKILVNLSAPTTLTLSQNNTSVTASGSGLSGFAYFDSGATDPDCSASNTTATYTNGSTASNLDDNDWVCFKAKNSLGVYAYKEYQVDLSTPTITITQDQDSLDASATAPTGTSLVDSSWAHSGFLTSSPTCSSGITYESAGSDEDEVDISSTNNGKWVCFKVKNDLGVYGFAFAKIDFNAPVVSVTQNGSTLTASATDAGVGLPSTQVWKHSGPLDTDPTCDSTITYSNTGNSVTSATDNKYYCFSVADKAGNFGYGEMEVNLDVPTINLSQNGNSLSASGSGLTGFAYFDSGATDPTCDASNTTATYTNGSTAYNLDDNDWVCFKAQKTSTGVWGYAKAQVDLSTPTITMTQDQDSLDASATAPTGTSLVDSSWAHSGFLDSSPTCSTASYESAGSDEDEVSVSSTNNDKWVCFKVKNNLGVYGYAKAQIDFTPPVVSITQNDSTLTASATDAGVGLPDSPVWKHTAAKTTEPTCSGLGDSEYSTTSNTVTSATDGKYYCFRVTDKAGNHGYGKILVNLSAPTITIAQDQDSLDASATAPTGTSLVDSSWAHATSLATGSSPTCSTATYATAGASENTFSITSSDNDKYLCFKVKNNLGVYGFALAQIDYNAPTVNIAQTLNVLDASSSSTDLPDTPLWQYKGPFDANQEPTCSTQTGWSSGSSVSSVENDKWYCFRVADKAGNYGYGKHQVDLSVPTIIIFQDIKKFVASGTANGSNLTDFSHFISSSDPDCRPDNTSVTWTSGRQTTNLTAGQWVCFKAKDSLNVWGSIEREINLDASTFSFSQDQTTLNFAVTETFTVNGKDVLRVTQHERNSLTFTSLLSIAANKNNWSWRKVHTFSTLQCDETNNSNFYNAHLNGAPSKTISLNQTPDHTNWGWCIRLVDTVNNITYYYKYRTSLFKYVKQNSSTCNSSTTGLTGIKDTLDITSSDNNKYICFSFENSRLVMSYDTRQVDFNAPSVSIVQDGSTLTASTTAADLKASHPWQKSSAQDSDPNCANLNSSAWSNGSSISNAADGKWYCFRVTDDKDNIGYGKIEVDLTAPTITLTQSGATVSASTTGLSDHKYFTKSTDPTCDSTASWSTATAGTSVSGVTNTHWVCFRAKNNLGVYGYAEHQVSLTAPTLTLSQDNTSVSATGTSLTGFEYFDNGGTEPDCDEDDTFTGTGTTASGLNDDDWVCFKAQNSFGVYGYAKLQVDLTAPTITLTQNVSTVSASTTNLSDHKYFTKNTDPTCDSTASWSTATAGTSVSSVADTHWVCFRAKNNLGVYGYAKLQVSLTVPTINLSQNGNSLSASGSGLSNFQYFDNGATDPTCDASNTSATYTAGSTASNLNDNDWVCFKAQKTSTGVWGYAKAQVDLSTPTITITQDQDSLDASATAPGSSSIVDSSWAHSGFLDSSPTCSTASYESAGSDEDEVSVSSTNNDKWVCFKVKNDLGVYGYAKAQVDFNAPVVSVTQNGSTLTASSTATDLPETPVWKHSGPLGSDPTCSSSSITYGTTANSVSSATDNKYYCFRVTDKAGNHGYGKILVNLSAPTTLTLSQNNTSVTASGSGLSGFEYFDSGATDPDCDEDDTFTGTGTTATGLDDNDWVCFKAKNSLGVYAYAKAQVDLSTPTITITQDQDSLDASATAPTGTSLVDASWAHSGFLTSSPTCSSSITYESAGSDEDAVDISSTNNGRWVCFKVKNNLGVYGYAFAKIDFNAPVVSVTQNGSTLTATATDAGVGLPSTQVWKHSGPLDSDPTCDSTITYGQSGNSVTNATDNKYYCFKVADKAGNFGYGEIEVNLDVPSINLSQNGSSLSASGSDLTDFAYFDSGATDPTCDASNTSATYTNGSTAYNLDDNDWVCFKAQNHLGVWGYAKAQVDLSTPTITITQDQDSLDASATAPGSSSIVDSSWAHSGFLDSSPTCSTASYESAGSDEDEVSVSSTNNDKWVCFAVKNDLGVYGYASAQVDFNAPVVSVTQNGSTLTASSTATDLPTTPVWKHTAAKTANPTCSGLGDSEYSTAANSVTSATDNKYYCFRVTDKAGNHGYGKILVNLSAPTTLTLSQNNTSVTASGSGLSGFEYFDSGATDPDCDEDDTFSGTGTTASNLDDNDWVCFKAKNSLGVHAYAKVQVDLSTPTITITQDQNSLDASATAPTGTSLVDASWAHSGFLTSSPTCSSGITYGSAGSDEDEVDISSTNNGRWVCFKVKNNLGVYGYAFAKIDFNAPVVSVTQNGSTLTASATDAGVGLPSTQVWKHSGPLDSDPTCSGQTYSNTGKTVTSATDNKYYCFRVADKAGNFGYGEIEVNLDVPTINLSQNGNSLSASGSGLTGFAYFDSGATDPTCDASNTSATYTAGTTATNLDDNDWVCFKAQKTSTGVWGYAKAQVDLSTPTITITQDQDSLDASATAPTGTSLVDASWAHSGFLTSSPTCSSSITYESAGSDEDEVDISSTNNGKWVCFKVKNNLGVYGYAFAEIDFNAPVVSVTQNGSTLTATATDAGVGLPSTQVWKHSGPLDSDPTCSSSSITYSNTGKTVTNATDNKYYCFRVADKAGNFGYGEIEVNLDVPTINLSQNGNSLSASGSGLTGFAYFDSGATDPTCDASNTSATYTNGSTATNLDDNDWVCFKAQKTSTGVWGYAKAQVDLSTPTITITQDQNSLDASATAPGSSSIVDSSWAHSGFLDSSPNCSAASYESAGSSEDEVSVSSTNNDKWVCFKVKNDLGVYGYAKAQIDFTSPVVSVTQNGSTLTATATDAGVGLPSTQVWKHSGPLDDDPTCSGQTYSNTGKTVTSATDGKYYCFKVTDKAGNHGYGKILVNLSAPTTLTLSQNNTSVTASGSGLSGFEYFDSGATDPDCDEDDTFSGTGTTATGLDDNDWVCFKAKNSLGVYAYAKVQVDLSTPTITITQDQNSLDASATAPTGTSLVDASWAHSGFLTSSPTCSSSITYESAGSDEDEVDISSTNNGKWVCFKVKNNLGVYGYAFAKIDFNAPVVSVTQNGSTLTASATDAGVGLPSTQVWKHSGPLDSDPTCDSSITYSQSGKTVSSATDNKYYCFRVTDKAGNHGYGEIEVNLDVPTINLSQNGNSLSASGSGLTGFAYFDSGATDPTCDASNTSATYTAGTTATNLDDNDWVCFKAQKTSTGVWGYAKAQVDLSTPTITITQDQDSLDASATAPGSSSIVDSSWAHSGFLDSSPTCSDTTITYQTAGSSEDEVSVSSTNNDKWVCFKVKNDLGVYGYAFAQVDFTSPVVSVTQNGSTLTATATDAGVGLPSSPVWKHSGPLGSDPTCSGQTYSNTGKTVTSATDGKYYCFKVTDKAGNHGYGKILVNLSAPTTLTLSQNNTSVTASGSGLSGFEYFDSGATDPDCDEDDTFSGTGTTATGLDDNDWVCFKAKNSLGVYAYAKVQVDLSTPTITITQDQDSLDASATAPTGTSLVDASWAHSGFLTSSPTCSESTITYESAGSDEDEVDISSTNNGRWVCFKVKNNLGVYGYAFAKIDFNAPVVSVTQNGSTLTASATDAGVGLPSTQVWKHSGPLDTDPTCSGQTYSNTGNSVTNATDNKYYCFRVADKAGNFGYGEIEVNLDVPTINLSQNGNSLSASGSGLTGFAYFDSGATDPTCDASNTSATYTAGSTASGLDDNDWVCFKAQKTSTGVWGYAKAQVDLSTPTITITQDQNSLDASATAPGSSSIVDSSWAHSGFLDNSPTCSTASYESAGSSEDEVSVSSTNNDKWVCFKVKNDLGVYGYAFAQVDFNAPVVSVTQNGSTLTATATDAGVGLPSSPVWKHSGPLDDDPTCSGQTYSNTGKTVSSATDNKYYCFKVTDKAGNHGYGKILVNLSTPTTLTLSQNNTSVTASGSGLSGFEYFDSGATDPDCDEDDTFTGTGTTATNLDDNDWVCFKAKNSLGVYAYAKVQVDLSTPTITITQDQDSLDASATAPTGTSLVDASWAHSGFLTSSPTCSSSITYESAGSDEDAVDISSTNNGRWVCFKVKNNLGVYGYAFAKIDFNAPVVSVTQNGSTLTATATDAGVGLPSTQVWKHSGPLDSDPTCDSSITYSNTGNSVSSATDNKYYCFRVADKAGNFGYGEIEVNLDVPTINLSQNGNSLSASGSGLTGFAYFDSGATDPTCDASNTSATYTAGTTATNLDDNDWVCFKAQKTSTGVWGYAKAQVDLSTPTITITQDQDSLDASATAPTGTSLVDSSWAHSGFLDSSPTCSDTTITYETAGSSEDEVSVSSTNNDKWVCFKVKNDLGVYGYAFAQVDFTSPVVSVIQNGSTLTASSTATDLPSTQVWKHSGPQGTDPTCSGQTYSNTGKTVSSATDNKYYCFRVTDKAGNHGYGKILVNLSAPTTLTLSQNNTSVTASGSGLSGFEYFDSGATDPDCDEDDTFTGTGTTATNLDDNDWVCFKAKNSLGVYAYAKVQVDLSTPTITITQDQDSLDASATAPTGTSLVDASWAHSGFLTSSPTCSSSITYESAGSDEDAVDISSTNNGKWVCFKVKNNLGVYGYAFAKIDFNAPVVSVTQNGSTLTASATDAGVGLPSTQVWKHSGPLDSDPTCDSSITYSNTGNSVSSATDNKYYCFKVADKAGNFGYGEIEVNLDVPTINLSQNGNSLSASGSGLTGFAYFDSGATDPTCDASNTSATYTAGTTATNLDDNDWVCFKAQKTSTGVWGYAKAQVDLSTPTITITQDQDSLDASATAPTGTSLVDSSWAHSGFLDSSPTCSDTTITYETAGSSEDEVSVSSTNNDKWVCFKVKNDLGVYGYAFAQVDFNAPVVSVIQNGSTLTASSTATDLPSTQVWKHSGPLDSDPTCSSSSITYSNTGKSVSSATDNKYYCFKVTDKAGNHGYGKILVNLSAPTTLTLSQNNTSVTASGSGLSGFEYFDSGATDPDCDEDDTFSGTGTTATGLDDNDWVCFKAKNSLGVYAYAKVQVDLSTPTITITQDQDSLDASATAPTGTSLVDASWAHSGFLTSSPTCSSSITYESAGTDEDEVDISSTNNGRWVCFKVKNNLGVYGYAFAKIDFNAPVVSVTQNGSTLTASATDAGVGLPSTQVWKHSGPLDSDPTCSSSSITYSNTGNSVSSATDNKYYCFRVADKAGNFGYGEIEVNLDVPTINLSQNGNSLSASGSGLTGFAYFDSGATDPTCDASNTSATYTDGSTATNLDDNDWVCFKAQKTSTGVWGYAKAQVDLSTPTITITQDQDSLDASATAPTGTSLVDSSWAHSGFLDSSPTCSDTTITYETAGSSEDEVSVSSTNNDKWVCFKVKNDLGVYGYAFAQVDFNAPVVSVTQNGSTLTASSTATDLPSSPVWKHSGPLDSDPTCSSSSITYSNTGKSVSSATDNKYYCFKVTDKAGNHGYGKILVNLSAPTTLTLSQNNTSVTASGSGLSGFEYFDSGATDPDCDEDDTFSGTGTTATGLDDNDWVCFKAKNSLGVYAYAKVQVDLSTPTITITQDQNSLDASATAPTGTSLVDASWAHSGFLTSSPTCSSSITYESAGSDEDAVDISSTNNGKWVCFKVKNNLGVYGYAFAKIDFTSPVVFRDSKRQHANGFRDRRRRWSAKHPGLEAQRSAGF